LLVALLKNGSPISLLDDWTKQQLERLRKQEIFVCPVCKSEVVLKIGKKRISHFAHRKEAVCAIESETESSYHLAGKADLYKWLKRQDIEVQLEPYIQRIRQRPDLLAVYKRKVYAIEYQCSTISEEMFHKRTASYMKAGIQPIWIVGAHRLHYIHSHFLKLSSFQWLFAQYVSSTSFPVIFSYCPKTQRFFRIFPLIPLSVCTTYSISTIHRMEHLSFAELFTRTSISFPNLFWEKWRLQKRRWRLTYMMYRNKENRFVCSCFYKHNITPALFPIEAGLPLKYGCFFETLPFVWQTYVLIIIMKKQTNSIFSFSDVYSSFSQMVRTGKVRIRNFSTGISNHYSRAINEYLLLLVQLGYLQRIERTTFQIIKPFTIPKTIEEALQKDTELLETIRKSDFLLKYE
jgi:competence protein CoiA